MKIHSFAKGPSQARGPDLPMLLIKAMFDNRFSDAECGFKTIKGSVAQELMLQVKDGEWFFDTELLLVAEKQGYRVSEVLVDWIEGLDS